MNHSSFAAFGNMISLFFSERIVFGRKWEKKKKFNRMPLAEFFFSFPIGVRTQCVRRKKGKSYFRKRQKLNDSFLPTYPKAAENDSENLPHAD